MAGFRTRFVEGFARLLDEQGVGTWNPDAAYGAGVTAIVDGSLPQSPERVIALVAYGVDDDPSLSDSTIGLQVSTRWDGQDPRDVGDLTDAVFDQLHGLHDVVLPTDPDAPDDPAVRVVQCLRRSWTSLGQDANNRWRTVQNFYVDVHRPSPNRT